MILLAYATTPAHQRSLNGVSSLMFPDSVINDYMPSWVVRTTPWASSPGSNSPWVYAADALECGGTSTAAEIDGADSAGRCGRLAWRGWRGNGAKWLVH